MVGRIAYGALFCVLLPVGMWLWASHARVGPALPVVHWPVAGWTITAAGVVLVVSGMWWLWRFGGGLPMNAYPTRWLVTTGPYALVAHPIYVGFVLVCAGASMAVGSAGGLWVVTPMAALGCSALVWGYERDQLRKVARAAEGVEVSRCRGGEEETKKALRHGGTEARSGELCWRPLLSLAEARNEPATWRERVGGIVMILLPWLVLYEAIGHVHSEHAVSTWLRVDAAWPVVAWTEWVYMLAYPMAIAGFVLAPKGRDLRRLEVAALVAMAVGFWCYLSLPAVTPPKAAVGDGLVRWMQELERADGLAGRAAMPSFHVCWVMLAAGVIGRRGAAWRAGAWAAAIAISAACVTTGMHGVIDVAGGAALFAVAWNYGAVWTWLIAASERVANTWHEWRVGRVRVLVHAVYAGIATLAGMLICGLMLDDSWTGALAGVALAGLFGGGAWGQAFEASSKLSRPFGYFGNVLGVGAGLVAVWAVRGDAWPVAAALAAAAPWIQAIGRIRCLVQGCCHGREARSAAGIVVNEPRSRVCALSDLGGKPIHATQLYSLVLNVAIGGPVLRMWFAGVEPAMIVGMSLALSGLGRFVEEHYRGEPQTAIMWGLRAYQWLAVAMVVSGAALMCVPTEVAAPDGRIDAGLLATALTVSVVYAAAMGVDFPGVQRRFARLAG
ncbi:MAG: hypothetical protein AMXMBFR58_28500 [Phycisphaerae bacterium]